MKKRITILRVAFLLLFIFLNAAWVDAQFNPDAPWMSDLALQNKFFSTSNPKFGDNVSAFNRYWEKRDFSAKGSGYKPFMRWQEFYKNALMPDGALPTPEFYWNIWKQKQSSKRFSQKSINRWMPMGPFDHDPTNSWSPGQGRVNVGIIDPNQPNVMYVGAPAGGIWKSVDYGEHWEPLSDHLPQIGVSGIAIGYHNSDVIYISTGDDDANDTFGVGVLKSVDGGKSWNKTGLQISNGFEVGNDIYIDPKNANRLWVATSLGVYKTEDAGENWRKTLEGNIKDIKIKPGNTDIVYAVTPNTFYKSTNGGNSFFVVRDGLPVDSRRLVIDVTPADPDYVYVLSASIENTFQGLYKSTNSGDSFHKTQETENILESSQAWYDLALAISDQDPNLVFVGCLNIWKSVDGGDNFVRINRWNYPDEATYTHADIHFLRYYNGRLLCGSDGGIYESKNNGNSFIDLTKGLQIGQFYKISVAENNSADYLVGGLQDNGGYALDGSQWNVYYGADGMDCAVQGNDDNTYYGFTQNGTSLYRTKNRGKSRMYAAGGPEKGNWVTPLVSDRNGNLYAGFSSFYKLIGSSFQKQTAFSFGDGNIDHIELDPSDINRIYAANGQDLFLSQDKGFHWSKIYSFDRFITSIEVHNDNNQIIYVSTAGSEGKIFRSLDQGRSFTDISGNLSGEGKFVVRHHKGTGSIYLGTYLGVYVKNDEEPWETYSSNLPNVAVRDLEINLKDNVIIAATYGRGVWKAPLYVEQAPDSIAPTIPNGLVAIHKNPSSVTLNWNASSDNIGVIGYDVYQGKEFIKFVNKPSATINGLSPNTNYEFKVVAKDQKGNQSAFSEEVITTTKNQFEIIFNFYKPLGWDDIVYAYFFSGASNTTLKDTEEWPGAQMINFSGTNWYQYNLILSEGVSPDEIRVVFNSKDNQTDDLSRSYNGWYQHGVWSDNCLSDCNNLNVATIDIYFVAPATKWNESTNIYLFDKNRNKTLDNTAEWPGQAMRELSGSPWSMWSFDVPSEVAVDDIGIVFNDGNGSQTIDLTRGDTGWFVPTFPTSEGKFQGYWSDYCPLSCDQLANHQDLDTKLPEYKPSLTHLQKAVISPNPMNDESLLKFWAEEDGILEVIAINVLGQKKIIHRQTVTSGKQTISLDQNNLNSRGVYFYTVYLNYTKQGTIRVVVQ